MNKSNKNGFVLFYFIVEFKGVKVQDFNFLGPSLCLEKGVIAEMELLSTEEIFIAKNIIIYLLAINLFGFLIMWIDKRRARKGEWRISENTLFVVTLLGGGIGTITGMKMFRHKTRKLKFKIGLPLILITEIVFVIYFIFCK